MRFLAHWSLLTLASLAILPAQFASADPAMQSTSGDVSGGRTANISFGSVPIEVRPHELAAGVGAGAYNGPGGKGVVISTRIDASTRVPLSFNERRAFGTNGARDAGVDVEFHPGLHAHLDFTQLDEDTKEHIRREDYTVSGLNLLRLWKCSTIENFEHDPYVDTCLSEQVGATVDLTIAAVGYKYYINTLFDSRQHGAELKVAQVSTHFGVQMGVPFDFCAQMAAGAVFGQYQIGDESTKNALFAELSACAGVQLGTLAEIRDHFDVRIDTFGFSEMGKATHRVSLNNTLSIERLGHPKNPLGLYWKHSVQEAGSASGYTMPITQDTFGIQGHFQGFLPRGGHR